MTKQKLAQTRAGQTRGRRSRSRRHRPPRKRWEEARGGRRPRPTTSCIGVMVLIRPVNVKRVVPALSIVTARKGGLPDV